ncbi:MAG: helix-turn-helix domain-containing protein [Clostridiales bacterium]|nr:helix-turn-helix domain-containing protein [Clostridiales bacterium]
MQYILEKEDPIRDMGGLCECFLSHNPGNCKVATGHLHRHFELLYCLEGNYEVMLENKPSVLHQGDAVLIHPMEPHPTRALSEGENCYLVLKFTPEALYSANHPLYEMKYIFPYLHFARQRTYLYSKDRLEGSGMEELLLRILKERREEGYGYEMAVRADISRVLLWFIRAWHDSSDMDVIDERTLKRLQKALSYIEAHMEEALTVQDVAEHLGMGVSTFSRFFAKAAGSSFPAYVRSLRLSRAMAMLVESNKSVTDIAMECGFNTSSYLILCFRKQYRLTPAQFRSIYAPQHG